MAESNIDVTKDGVFRYGRISFDQAGQDSDQSPPAQNEEMFELLENVMPPTDGDFQRRWGYELFNNPSLTARRMYEFQDEDQARAVVLTATTGVESLTEAGAAHNTAIFTPTSPTRAPRMVMSRGYGFFADGVAADLKKWDGSSSGGVTGWGIASPEVTSTASGPSSPGTLANTTETGTVAWTNAANAAASDDVYATAAPGAGATSQWLTLTNFGFSLSGSATILGIKVEVERKASTSGDQQEFARLRKNGAQVGVTYTEFIDDLADAYTTFGIGTSDLWGETWTAADINATNFGISYQVENRGGGASTTSVDHIRVTVYYSVPIVVGATSAGSVTLVSGRKYTLAYRNSTTGHLSNIAPFSESTGPITTDLIPLSAIPVSVDSQVDRKLVLATADGGDETLLYELVDLPNATTTYNDDTPEVDLLTHNIYLEVDDFGFEHGLAENDPPPNGDFPTPHRGRMYMAVGELLYFSKSINELSTSTGVIAGRWEEAWPGDFFLDVSAGAETIRGLLSDGQVLYIGTERRILRLFGDGPQTFSKPETAFNDVGILNQEVWKPVFREGQAVGVMWLTPDMRLVLSDMNNYAMVGQSVQDILDSVNRTVAESVAWASFFSSGDYNLYVLAVPTGVNTEPDTLIVYDLRRGLFVVWRLLDKATAGLNNIKADGSVQFLFGASTGKVYNLDSAAVQDRVGDTPANFTATIRTSFQHFGNPLMRKVLTWMQVLTGDSGLLVSVDGASTKAEYDSPSVVVTDSAVYADPLGDFQVRLAGKTAKDRSYRLQFKSTGQVVDILSGVFVEGKYIHSH